MIRDICGTRLAVDAGRSHVQPVSSTVCRSQIAMPVAVSSAVAGKIYGEGMLRS